MESDDDIPAGFIEDALRLELEGELNHYTLADFKPALLAALEDARSVMLDVSRAWGAGAAFAQFVCAAHRSFAAQGKSLQVSGIGPEAANNLKETGFCPRTALQPEPGDTLLEAMSSLTDRNDAETGAGLREDAQEAPPPPGVPGEDPLSCPGKTFRILFAPSDPGHLGKLDPAVLLAELRQLGQARITLDASAVPALEDLDPSGCRLRWEILLTTRHGLNAVLDVFLFLDNPGDAVVEELDAEPAQASAGTATPPAGQPRAEAALQPAHPGQRAPMPAPGLPKPASPACPDPASPQDRPTTRKPAQSLRVEAAKLDNLVNLVGELVIAQARLAQIASGLADSGLTGVSEDIDRLVGELRDNTLGIRMLPIGTTFSRFRRLVRDLSSELGKEIELVAEGGETELDKTVIEQLGDSLVHLLRNSIDHGVEPPGERAAGGKPRRGTIRLSAKQTGGSVVIRIKDDGRGLDTERIRAKAVERGIIAPETRLSDQDAFQLIFAPGFSTAGEATSVSGRGVGMDVVKRAIETLRGVIGIDSQPGEGTAFTISLPLTLAIIDGLQVRAAGEFYIIPLAMVEECVELVRTEHPAGQDAQGCGRNRTLSIRGEIIPYIRLRETFFLDGKAPRVEQVVITRHDGDRTGLAVDEVIGQQQAVIKGLGRLIGRVEGFSGATINGDGSMALILDVPQLAGSVQRQCGEACPR